MSNSNANKFMTASSEYIINLDQTLRSIKSDLIIDFIHIDHWGLIVTFNRVASSLDISIISKYIKNCNKIDINDIQDIQLSQSKLYLKIFSILYIIEGTNVLINSKVIETFIKSTYIFNNINIASRLHIIKVFPKFDIVIV